MPVPRGFETWRCASCGATDDNYRGICALCGTRSSMHPWRRGLPVDPRQHVQRADEDDEVPGRDEPAVALTLDDIEEFDTPRISSGIPSVDRVAGTSDGGASGLARGAVYLISGQPGCGKSTLALQICALGAFDGARMYVSGEESRTQIKRRAKRLGYTTQSHPQLLLMPGEFYEDAEAEIIRRDAQFVVFDSLQRIGLRACDEPAGHITCMKELMKTIMRRMKQQGRTAFIVGHINANGEISGEKGFEHDPDALLMLEPEGGKRENPIKLLRCMKNREGANDYIGRLRMTEKGLQEIEADARGVDANGPERGERLPIPDWE